MTETTIRCAQCPRELRAGEPAYVVEYQAIIIRGDQVVVSDEQVIVCVACMEDGAK